MPTDPVCGMVVEESPETLHATVHGTTYYFCSESCLREFTRPELELRNIKFNLVLSAALGVPILFLSYVPVSLPISTGVLLLLLATPVQFIAGYRFYRGTYDAIRMGSSNMDVLIAVGTSAAYFYSLAYVLFPKQFPFGGLYFDTSAVVIALILLGRLLEYDVRGRATEAIRKLADLQPRTVTILETTGGQQEIPIEKLEAGNDFLVHPGERIATDGVVLEGQSFVDEKLLTGESLPMEKKAGSDVIGGTINGSEGALKVRATKVGEDTTLSKIVQIVQQALNSKGPVERLVDTVSIYFVPIVIVVALISFLAWTFVAREPTSFGFTTAVAVLIIACPCALGLATPAAIAVGAGKGAENGILIKGGESLERTEKIDTVVFDKTGTLTNGVPVVTDIESTSQFSQDEILKLAAIAEKRSEHPVALAVVKRAEETFQSLPDPEFFQSVPGAGVKATFSGREIRIGTASFLGMELDPEVASKVAGLQSLGKTVSLVSIDGKLVGWIAVADTPKKYAAEALEGLRKMKLEVMMLTGDNRITASAIAHELGIQRFEAEVPPEKKYEVVKQLQAQGHRVAMVGDGVNDAPALAQADVGIALGSGSDVAAETGGLILMKDDLRDVVAAIQLSRKTMGKIRQNLFWAFAYNIALIPIAAGLLYIAFGVLLNPIFAGLAMALSSVTVVSNSLTLRRFKPKF